MNKKLVIPMMALILGMSLSVYAQEDEQQNDRPRHHKGKGPRIELTDEQKTCLKGILGKRGEAERPSHEKMDAAFKSCGVEKPQRPPRHHVEESASES